MYAGMYLDPVTGLYYDKARWYDAVDAVFASQDPEGFAAGDTNTSRYCFLNVRRFSDGF
jgi:RHS repeat-associated protein